MPFQQRDGGNHHSWCADAALRAATFEKSFLHRVQLRPVGDALDGANLLAIRLHCRDEATVDDNAIHQHRARSAFSLAATFFRPGEMEFLAQYIQQTRHRIHMGPALLAIHLARDVDSRNGFSQARLPSRLPLSRMRPSTLPGSREFR